MEVVVILITCLVLVCARTEGLNQVSNIVNDIIEDVEMESKQEDLDKENVKFR